VTPYLLVADCLLRCCACLCRRVEPNLTPEARFRFRPVCQTKQFFSKNETWSSEVAACILRPSENICSVQNFFEQCFVLIYVIFHDPPSIQHIASNFIIIIIIIIITLLPPFRHFCRCSVASPTGSQMGGFVVVIAWSQRSSDCLAVFKFASSIKRQPYVFSIWRL